MAGVVAIIQARMGSSRLPGKVLEVLGGEPMLARVVRRVGRARHVDEVVVATSDDGGDDAIQALCQAVGVRCVRGSLGDVLGRYWRAAQEAEAEEIVRVTADCPFIDPGLVDQMIEARRAQRVEYVTNALRPGRTYPIGLDVEVFTRGALEEAFERAAAPNQREHVTPYFYDGSSARPWALIRGERLLGDARWTVDTPEDLAFARAVLSRYDEGAEGGWERLADFLEGHPELVEINRGVYQKTSQEVDERANKEIR